MSKAFFGYSRFISYIALIGCLTLLFAVPLDSPRVAVVVSLCNVILAVWLCVLLVRVPAFRHALSLLLMQRAEHDATLQALWLTNRRAVLHNLDHLYKSLRDLASNSELALKQNKANELAALLDQKIKEFRAGESSDLEAVGEIERLKEQWEREAEKERKKAQNQMADLEARLKKAEENGKKKSSEIEALQAKIKEAGQKVKDNDAQVAERAKELAEVQELLKQREKESAADKATIEALKKKLGEVETTAKQASEASAGESATALAELEKRLKEEANKSLATQQGFQQQLQKVNDAMTKAEEGLKRRDEELANAQQEKEVLQAELKAQKDKCAGLEEELKHQSSASKDREGLQKQHEETQLTLSQKSQRVAELEAALQKEESARKAAEAHVTESEAAIAKQKADQEDIEHELQNSRKDYAAAKKEIEDLMAKVRDLTEQQAQARTGMAASDEERRKREEEAINREKDLRDKLAALQQELKGAKERHGEEKKALNDKVTSLLAQIEGVEAKLKEADERNKEIDKSRSEKIEAFENRLQEIQEELKKKNEALAEAEKERATQKADLEKSVRQLAEVSGDSDKAKTLEAQLADERRKLSEAQKALEDEQTAAANQLAQLENAQKELAAVNEAKTKLEGRQAELQKNVDEVNQALEMLKGKRDKELGLLRKQLQEAKASELSMGLASNSPMKALKSPSPMAVSSPAERPQQPVLNASATESLTKLLEKLKNFIRASSNEQDPNVIAQVSSGLKELSIAPAGTTPSNEASSAGVLADLLACAEYAAQERAKDQDPELPKLDSTEIYLWSAHIVADSIRLLLDLAKGVDLSAESSAVITIDANERRALEALYFVFRTRDEQLKKIAYVYNSFDYWLALLINSPRDLVREIFVHVPIASPAKKNYVVVFMKVADTDKKVEASNASTTLQQSLMEQQVEAALAAFAEADKDGKGHLSYAQAGDLIVKLFNLSAEGDDAVELRRKVTMLAGNIDKDMSGTIEMDEVLEVYGKLFAKKGN